MNKPLAETFGTKAARGYGGMCEQSFTGGAYQ